MVSIGHIQKVKQNFKKAAQGIPHECTIIHKHGKLIPLLVANIPIIIENEVVGVYAIVKDVTLLKVAEKNIEKSEKLSLVGQLSAAIAHEIRNPLTTLKGFLELSKKNKEFSLQYVDIMLSEMNRMDTITSELLLLAKPQAVDINFENINDLLEDVVTLLQPKAIMKDIEINFYYENVVNISCVSNQLKQVFINILKNAIESMNEGGVIKVNLVRFDKDNLLIEIIDQGCGIPDEIAPNIGLPFYSTKDKGTGLGMLTTYKIIQEHGGKISFESKLEEGTTFRIYLPNDSKLNEEIT